ncbi:MAG: restriction endonuclease subunit S [Desulfobacteraceae bacterium]|nr:restriction endonuclease subunit S [Desulfobacteraceae bacterium]MBL7171838.1 restriction endonuclease subunit S [Desulfobacteraceae bacterium]
MGSDSTTKWIDTTIGGVVDIFDYKRIPLSGNERKQRQGPYPYYGASGIIDYIDDFIFDGRHLLIAEDGENLNSRKLPVAFFAQRKFWVNNHAHIVRAKNGVADDHFLFAWFAQANISGYITGAAQPKLSQANLKRIELRLPPLPTQRKIASILSAYDDLIENNLRRIKILEEMAQALYREWFVKFRFPGHEKVRMVDSPLGKIPEGWEVSLMKDVVEVIDCLHSKKPEASEEGVGILIQLFNVVDGGKLDFSRKYMISENDYVKWTSRIEVSEGDCVITNVGRIAAVAQMPTGVKAALGRNMTGVRPIAGKLTPTYLIEYLLSPHMEDEVRRKKDAGAIMDSLNVRGIYLLSVPIPCGTLMHDFEAIARPIRRRVELLVEQNYNLRQTRNLLLPKLISGELDVSDLDIYIPEEAA